MPKNLIVIAGESNAGKTALMLGMVAQNIAHYDKQYGRLSDSKRPRLSYFSSEMGPAEFRDRVDDFPHPLEFWDTMHAYERTENFHQVLDPNGLNFIDYLEVYDNFYEVGFKIRQIFDRLSGGVCVLALQKNQGTHYGLGGMHSVHKPRLYLSLASHAPYFSLMTITKAKSWASKTNPNGLSLAFKLSADAGFVSLGGWERREEKDIQALVKACKEQEGGEESY